MVHYRWHPLYGRRVRRHYSEHRASGELVHIEAAPGVVTAVQAWMLDPVVCAGMNIGLPRVTLSALIDLHDLLTVQGFRRSSSDRSNVVQEDCDEAVATGAVAHASPIQSGVRPGETPRP